MSEIMTEPMVEFERIPSGITGAVDDDNIFISNRAIEMINAIRQQNEIQPDHFLRIGTRGGGCSGMSYTLGFDNEFDEKIDRRHNSDKLNLVVDARSLFYLMGVTLDYVESPEGSGFVFNNPNNAHTCGCQG